MAWFSILSTLFYYLCLSQPSHSQPCRVRQIIFSNDGEQLYVRFNSKVDTTNLLDTPSSCHDYFDSDSNTLLWDSLCTFTSELESNAPNSTLLIQLSPNATMHPNTESLTLLSNAFQCANTPQTVTVSPPDISPNTQITIDSTVPSNIGACDNFLISAYASTGMTFRVYEWTWVIRNGRQSQTYYTGQTPQLTLDPIDIPYSGIVAVTVTVHTYLFTSAIAHFKVTKSELPSPDMTVLGPQQWIYSEALTFVVQISHTACAFDDTLYTFDIDCTVDNAVLNRAVTKHSNQFYIPSGLMTVGNTYIFTCEASSKDGVLIGTSVDTLSVQIVSGAVIAGIAGGNALQLIRNPLTLDGQSLSYSWSNIGGSIENAQIKWECHSLANANNGRRLLQMSTTAYFSTTAEYCHCPSVVTTEYLLNIPSNTLQNGCKYEFEIEIDNGDNVGTDSVIIDATDFGLSIAIWRDNACVNENNDIELRARAETDTESSDAQVLEYFWEETSDYLKDFRDWQRTSDMLVIPKGTLAAYITYEFAVTVTISDSSQSASQISKTSKIEILVNDAPTITRFEVTAENNNDGTVEDTYTLLVESFSDYAPNSYQFFWRYNNDTFSASDNRPLTAQMSSNAVRNVYLPEGDLIITAAVYDLCNGVSDIVKYVTVNHKFGNITCAMFYATVVQPLFETAASVKDYNRVLNVFDIVTATIAQLSLQQTSVNSTVTNTSATCYTDIIDAFAVALEVVTLDLDVCYEETTILQTQLLAATNLAGELSVQSNQIFSAVLDIIWEGCAIDNGIPLCGGNDDGNHTTNTTIECINGTETSIFSGILTPEQVFRRAAVTPQQIAITLALMDSILSSYSMVCGDIQNTIYNLFALLESIVATDFPNDAQTMLVSHKKYYHAFVRRVAPQTEVTVTFEDGDTIIIGADVTLSGRQTFKDYGTGELDSVDIFVIKISQDLLSQCKGELIPNALDTDRVFESDNNADKTRKCGEVLTDTYLIEIDMDGDTTQLTDNITYSFQKTNTANKCQSQIANITDMTQDLSTSVDTTSFTLCGHYPSILPSNMDDLVWDYDGCVFIEETDSILSCHCNHLSFHSVSKVYLIQDIEIESLLENKYIFYVIVIGFALIGFIALIQVTLILYRGYCKLEASVMIYYALLIGCALAAIQVYALSTEVDLEESNEYLSLDVLTSSVRFMILDLVLNTWFRLKMGKKSNKSRLERWPLNCLIVAMIVYDIFCVVISVTNDGRFDDIFVVGNLIVNIASGSLAVIWLLWRPILCLRRCRKKQKIMSETKGYVLVLWLILILVCTAYVIQSMLVMFATTQYFNVDSSNTPLYVSQWRLINYCVDIASWLIIACFYICIYVHSTKGLRNNPSQIGAIFKGSKFKLPKKKEPTYVENSYSHGPTVHINPLEKNDATSPKKKKKKKKFKLKNLRANSHSEAQPTHMHNHSQNSSEISVEFNPWKPRTSVRL